MECVRTCFGRRYPSWETSRSGVSFRQVPGRVYNETRSHPIVEDRSWEIHRKPVVSGHFANRHGRVIGSSRCHYFVDSLDAIRLVPSFLFFFPRGPPFRPILWFTGSPFPKPQRDLSVSDFRKTSRSFYSAIVKIGI